MKKKELKKIAETIAQQEKVLANAEASASEKQEAKNIILNLMGRIIDIEDMLLLDDYIQNILKK